jgi:hypothetical protein
MLPLTMILQGYKVLYNLLFVVDATVASLRKEGTGVNILTLRGVSTVWMPLYVVVPQSHLKTLSLVYSSYRTVPIM